MGGWPGKGARLLCPGDLYNEHDELESVLKRCKKINRQTEEFERTLQKAPNAGGEKQKVLMDCLYAQREVKNHRSQTGGMFMTRTSRV